MSTQLEAKTEQVLRALATHGIMSTAEVEQIGMSREYLRQMAQAGQVQRITHGLYRLPGAPISADTRFTEVSRVVPGGVICLLSALRVHQLTTQMPADVWIAVENGAWTPRTVGPPMRIVEMSGPAFHEGIEHRIIDNVSVPVYGATKTVADCFKFRNKIGLDVAIEALRDFLRQNSVPADDLWHYAKICRVTNVIRPYLEAMQTMSN